VGESEKGVASGNASKNGGGEVVRARKESNKGLVHARDVYKMQRKLSQQWMNQRGWVHGYGGGVKVDFGEGVKEGGRRNGNGIDGVNVVNDLMGWRRVTEVVRGCVG